MKLFLNKLNEKEGYIDLDFWSLIKVNFLTSLAIFLLFWGSLIAIALISFLISGIF